MKFCSLHDRSPEVVFCQPREEQTPVNFSNKALAKVIITITINISTIITFKTNITFVLVKVDYSQPHQLVAEAQQCRQRVQTGDSNIIQNPPTYLSNLSYKIFQNPPISPNIHMGQFPQDGENVC